jgi:DNA (cytosine-5)-methyltransferase 1
MLAGLGFEIQMPSPTHSRRGVRGLPLWRTLRDAIDGYNEATTIDRAAELGGFDAVDWHIVRRLGTANLSRLQAAIPGQSRKHIPDELRPHCHKGEDNRFRNTYGRMAWDRPASTITAGCLSPSKGRFGHPEELRTLTFREASLVQTFPPKYKFVGNLVDRSCEVLGNALPCLFAERLAQQVVRTIERSLPWLPEELLKKRSSIVTRLSTALDA